MAQRVVQVWIETGAQRDPHGVAGNQVDQGEHDDADTQQRQNHLKESSRQESCHGPLP